MTLTGSEFSEAIATSTGQARESLAMAHFLTGSRPSWLDPEKFAPILITQGDHRLVVRVSPDVFSVGTDADFLRMPLWPATAQAVADQLNAILPSRKLSRDIYDAALVKLHPQPIPPSPQMEASATFTKHNGMVNDSLAKNLAFQTAIKNGHPLIAGHKKDVVVGPNLNGEKVAIYGWNQLPDGSAIQPYSTIHGSQYSDYSHGIRLIGEDVVLDGQKTKIRDVFLHPTLHTLVSDQGPFDPNFPNSGPNAPSVQNSTFRKAFYTDENAAPTVRPSSALSLLSASLPALAAVGIFAATLTMASPKAARAR